MTDSVIADIKPSGVTVEALGLRWLAQKTYHQRHRHRALS